AIQSLHSPHPPQSSKSAASSTQDTPALKKKSSCLSHPIQHRSRHSIPHPPATKKSLQIINNNRSNLATYMPPTPRHMRSNNRPRQSPQPTPDRQRPHRIGHINRAPQTPTRNPSTQSLQINQPATRNINNRSPIGQPSQIFFPQQPTRLIRQSRSQH